MKKLTTLMLGLSLVLGAATFASAQDKKEEKKQDKKKKKEFKRQ